MPLLDHFRPPVGRRRWESFHRQWPAMIVERLAAVLPPGFVAAPGVRVAAEYEVDVGTLETDAPAGAGGVNGVGGGGTALLAAPPPTLTAAAPFAAFDEFEVEIFDEADGETLVAAVEFVSPRNKDRAEARQQFAGKCATLVGRGVCVAIVDVVVNRTANLYGEALDLLGVADPALEAGFPPAYAVSLRRRTAGKKPELDAWAYPLEVGKALPSLPLWLGDDRWVPLELEASYDDTCRILHAR